MSAPKPISRPSARRPMQALDVDRRRSGERPPHVELTVIVDWLKGQPIATAELTPVEALHLAEQLTRAARSCLGSDRP